MSVCCPGMDCFPKHVMLGEALGLADDCSRSEYRQEFISTPLINSQKESIDRMITLHKRMVLLIEMFSVSRVNSPQGLLSKVTPSADGNGLLADQAIPFYYDIAVASAFGIGTLQQNWSATARLHCNNSADLVRVSYANNDIIPTTPQHQPLLHCTSCKIRHLSYALEGL